jgi:tape measure domain-containing protein
MSEISIGDVVGRLRLDADDFSRGLLAARQALQAFQQQTAQVSQGLAGMSLTSAQTAMQAFSQAVQQASSAQTQLTQTSTQTAQSVQQLGTSATAGGTALAALAQQVQEAGAQMQAAQTHAHGMGEGLRLALSVAGGLGIATSIRAIVSQMVEFGTSVITTGAQLQQLRAGLNAVSGGVQEGAKQFQFIVETANRLGFGIVTLTQTYRNLEAATRGTSLAGAETQKIFTAIVEASRVLGASQHQVHSALLAVEQMVSKGTVSMEELRKQLGNALPGAFEIAARAMGVTTTELNALVKSGEVAATDLLPKLGRQLRLEFGAAAAEASKTASVAFQQFGNELLFLKDRIANNGILQFFQSAAAGVAALMKATREAEEQWKRFNTLQTQKAIGTTAALPADAEKLLAVTEKLTRAEDALKTLRAEQKPSGLLGLLTGPPMAEGKTEQGLQKEIDLLRLQQTELAAVQKLRIEGRKGLAARENLEGGVDALTEQRQREADATAANEKLQTLLKATAADLTRLDKQAKETPQAFGSLTGNADQQIEFLDNKIKILRDNLEKLTVAIVARPNALGMILPDDARQKAAMQTQLAQAEAQKEAIKEAVKAADAAERAAERAAEAAKRRAEQLADQAKSQAAGLEASLGRVTTFLESPSQSLAEQAKAKMVQEGAALQAVAEKALETIRKNPFIPQDLAVSFQAALEGLPDAVALKGQQAFEKIEQQQLTSITKMGDELDQLRLRLSAAGLSPLDADLARISRQFEDMRDKLLAMQQAMTALRLTATPAGQSAIDAQQQGVETLLTQIDPQRDTALAERQQRPEQAYLQRLRNQLAQLQAPRGEGLFGESRSDVRRDQQGEEKIQTEAGATQARLLRAQITAQEHLNYAVQVFEGFANSVGNAWGQALTSIATGTQTVAGAFRAMTQSILQSIAQLAAQEAWKSFIQLGAGLIRNLFAPTVGGATFTGVGVGEVPTQGGAIINSPTRILAGENPAMNPEYVLNRPQMQQLMASAVRAAPSAGGQAATQVHIYNVATRAQAEEGVAQQRAKGHEAIINEVLSEMSRGESSRIVRMMRTTQR